MDCFATLAMTAARIVDTESRSRCWPCWLRAKSRGCRVANGAHEVHPCNLLATPSRGLDDRFHTAAMRRWNHPRDTGCSRGVVATAQATDAGGDDPRVEHGVYRRLGREYCPARHPAGAAGGRGFHAV